MRRVIVAWRKGDDYAARLRQEKRAAEEARNVLLPHRGRHRIFEATYFSLVDEPEEPRVGTRRTETTVVVDA